MSQEPNFYDNISIDINKLFEENKLNPDVKNKSFLIRFINRYISALLLKLNLYSPLVEVGFINTWFKDFTKYWKEVFDGRPLYIHDFYFLLGVYRQKFQTVETPNHATKEEFLDSWQNDSTLYQLFGAVRRFSRTPLIARRYEAWIKSSDKILEYGCGLAPISYSLLNYSLIKNLDITISDIKQINYHYAKYRLGDLVDSKDIELTSFPSYEKKFNTIFMITVMEHLPNPLETVKFLTESLEENGIFVFDYILGDGDGQDTIEAIEQRKNVLDFISENFEIIKGNIKIHESMEQTVGKLK